MNSRRGFLKLLGGAAATATLDPERMLWVPGKRVISIPRAITPQELTFEGFHKHYIAPYLDWLERQPFMINARTFEEFRDRYLDLSESDLKPGTWMRL